MSSPQFWLLDTCCALNLAASGNITSILRTPIEGMHCHFVLVDQVRVEATALRRGGDGADAEMREIIDWQNLIDDGVVEETSLHIDETVQFLDWLRFVDEGEAACLAIAVARGWGVVTDDIVARKRAGDIALLATPDVLWNWAQTEKIEPNILRETLLHIRVRARYGPPRVHPLRQWWLDAMNTDVE